MPSSPERVVRRVLADGTIKEYRYSKKVANRYSPDSVFALLQAYRRSPEWQAHSAATKRIKLWYFRDLEELADWRVTEVKRRTLLAMMDAIATERGRGAG